MSPTIVQNKGQNVLVLGSPGSSRIISTVAQITAKWVEDNDINTIVEEPRIHISKNKVYLENELDTLDLGQPFLDLYNLKYQIPDKSLISKNGLNPYFGGVHAIAKENNLWNGVADSRRDGKTIVVLSN